MKNMLEQISFDDMMDVLADVQRRKLLIALLEHNPQADALVGIADSDSERGAVEPLVTMQHVHLPKLDDYRIIEWNEETHEVRKGPAFNEIRPLLELLYNHEDELPADWI